ncbi:MAG TPA: TonB-dependent receptor [Alphaproteobacteria bacterium]|nr:TonB-dependent receptor [Alphaproteobacteria bacterium]
MSNRIIVGLLACASIAALGHNSALAQQAGGQASSAGQLEEIVVTAEKRSENQQIVPVSVTAISPTMLANARIQNAMDLAGTVPNLFIMQGASMNGSTSTPWMTLRGIEANNTGTVQTDSGIGIYVDGVYVARASGQVFDLADVEQIEVLRGPQGTLFGRDSVGGAINFITRDPTGAFGVNEDLSFGNLGEIRNKTRLDFDELAGFRLSLTYFHSQDDGYIKNLDAGHYVDPSKLTFGAIKPGLSQRDLGAHDADGVMASLRYDPPAVEGLTFKVKLDYTGEYETPPGIQLLGVGAPAAFYYPPPYGFGVAPRPGNIHSRGTIVVSRTPQDAVSNSQAIQVYLQTYGASLTTTYDLADNIQLKDIVAYRRLQQDFSSQLDGGNALVAADGNDFIPFTSLGQVNQHQLSNEFDLTYKSSWVDVTAGQLYFYEQYHYPDGYPVLKQAHNGVLPAYYDPKTKTLPIGTIGDGNAVSTAEFAQANIHLLDNLDLVAGIRYTRDDKESRYPLNPGDNAEFIHQRVDWLGGVNYRPTDNVLVYGKGSSGYISGGSYNGVNFGPESMTQFELGEKADLLGKQLRINTAIFWSDYRHYQTFDFNPGDCNGQAIGCIVNAGAERIWGLESEITYVPTDRLILSANVGITRYSLDANQNPSAIPENHAPKLQFGVSGDYNFDEINGMTPSARLEVNYQGLIDWGPTAPSAIIPGILESYKTPEQVIVNARVSLADIPMGPVMGKVSLWGKNITNTQYFSEILPGSVIGFVDGNVSPPATYGVDLSFKWGASSAPAETAAAYTPPPVQAPMASPRSYLVFFDFNKSDLTSQATQIVDQAASNAGPAKVTRLTVTGHTDTVGSDAYNMRLSRRRAESVAARLEKDGIASSEIEIVAKGKRDLLVPTADGVREPQNRRVQIVYDGGPTS